MNNQLIVVAPDEVVKAAEEAEAAPRQPQKGIDFTKIGQNALEMLYGASFVNVVVTGAEALIAWSKARLIVPNKLFARWNRRLPAGERA